jgi:sodium-coupled neutral amino acid transporter 9
MANNSQRYNRNKYYSALKTGFKHMNPEAGESFL